ncbi:MAG: GNAT family N-acetyltransferase [Butyrivibrio sp.]|nr:GNAT family N-acetyltransferase [Butyrivibrio sp.]
MKIREFVEADYQNLYETLSDPEVMKYIEEPYSEEKTLVFLQDAGLCDKPLIYAAENDNGNYVGYVIYHDYDISSVEIGWILKKSEWGKEYARELTKPMQNI